MRRSLSLNLPRSPQQRTSKYRRYPSNENYDDTSHLANNSSSVERRIILCTLGHAQLHSGERDGSIIWDSLAPFD
jgi:hypothetical protein